jgi:hypothetical protein
MQMLYLFNIHNPLIWRIYDYESIGVSRQYGINLNDYSGLRSAQKIRAFRSRQQVRMSRASRSMRLQHVAYVRVGRLAMDRDFELVGLVVNADVDLGHRKGLPVGRIRTVSEFRRKILVNFEFQPLISSGRSAVPSRASSAAYAKAASISPSASAG